jgi:hypothetical protein
VFDISETSEGLTTDLEIPADLNGSLMIVNEVPDSSVASVIVFRDQLIKQRDS